MTIAMPTSSTLELDRPIALRRIAWCDVDEDATLPFDGQSADPPADATTTSIVVAFYQRKSNLWDRIVNI
jgi:hypothetical protein